jgi:hypothetical protein
VREGDAFDDARDNHRDDFLRAGVLTVGVRPFGPQGWKGRLDLRVGAGRGTAKREFTHRDEEPMGLPESGPAILAGASYLFRLGSGLSFGADLAWGQVLVDEGVVRDGSFSSAIAVVQWHP